MNPSAVAPRGLLRRVGVAGALVLTVLLLFAAWLLTAPEVRSAREITRARLQELRTDGSAAAEREVVLPDAWEASAPARSGRVRYRLALPDAALQGGQGAVLMRRVGNAFTLTLNGHRLAALGEGREPLPDFSREPRQFLLPPALLRASGNELAVEVIGQARREAGLSTLWVGPQHEIEALYQRAMDEQVRSGWFVAAASAAMGLLALLLAWRVRQAPYVWFGAASLLWAWRMGAMTHGNLGHWATLLQWSFQASYVGFVVLMSLYALAVVGRDSARVRRALGLWSVAALSLTTFGLAGAWPWMYSLVSLGDVLLALWLLTELARASWRGRGLPAVLLTACAAVSVAVGARDFIVFRVLHDYGAYTWVRYTVVLLIGTLAWMLVSDFARSIEALRELNRGLLDTVAAKERELATAFEGQRARERDEAARAERDRILREMHDGVGGRLVAALALTQRAQSLPPADAMQELRVALDECLTELRLALDSLDAEPQPVVQALAELRFRVEPSLRAAGIRIVWQVDEAASEVMLPPAHTLHVLRIVREALTNVIKHARANTVWLRLAEVADATGRSLHLSVADNGASPEAATREPLALPSGGRGLASMRRRAQALGAALETGPSQQGWAMSLVIPL